MADQTYFGELSKNKGVDLITNELDVLDGVAEGRVKHWAIECDIEAIQLNHLLSAPDSKLTVKRCRHEICVFRIYLRQRSYSSSMAFEYV